MLGPVLPPKITNRKFVGQKSNENAFVNPITNQACSQREALVAFEGLKKKRFDEIYTHELAHKNAGGALAGDIVIEKDANGIAFTGHVDIKMPALDKKNPEACLKDAEIVQKAAMAPGDPSGQDKAVANKASNLISRALSAIREFFGFGQKGNNDKIELNKSNPTNPTKKLDLYS